MEPGWRVFFSCRWTSSLFPEASSAPDHCPCHVASCFTVCCISLYPVSLTPWIPGATEICHVIAHYQVVSILRALKCLLMARRPWGPRRPSHCHIKSQLGLSFSCWWWRFLPLGSGPFLCSRCGCSGGLTRPPLGQISSCCLSNQAPGPVKERLNDLLIFINHYPPLRASHTGHPLPPNTPAPSGKMKCAQDVVSNTWCIRIFQRKANPLRNACAACYSCLLPKESSVPQETNHS